MLPIFKEYIQFLKDKGCDTSKLREGCFWVDNQIIKCFARERELLSICELT